MTPGQVKRRSGHRLATTDVLLVAAVAVVGGVCGASGECTGVVWRLLAGLRSLASAGQDGSLCLFVLQLGLCIGFVCGAWLFIALRGLAAPRPPSELDQPQHELVACACSQVEQSALSATAPGEAVPVAHCCEADVAFAARRHISSPSAGHHAADSGSKGRQAAPGSSMVDAGTGAAGKGVSGTWVEVDALAFGSGGVRRGEAARWRAQALLKAEGQAGLQRHARVPGRCDGAGSHRRSRRQGRRRGGRGRSSAGVAVAEGLAAGLARMDHVTFSTLKPTFCVVSESE